MMQPHTPAAAPAAAAAPAVVAAPAVIGSSCYSLAPCAPLSTALCPPLCPRLVGSYLACHLPATALCMCPPCAAAPGLLVATLPVTCLLAVAVAAEPGWRGAQGLSFWAEPPPWMGAKPLATST